MKPAIFQNYAKYGLPSEDRYRLKLHSIEVSSYNIVFDSTIYYGINDWRGEEKLIIVLRPDPFYRLFVEIKDDIETILNRYAWSCDIDMSFDADTWHQELSFFKTLHKMSRKQNEAFYIYDYIWRI